MSSRIDVFDVTITERITLAEIEEVYGITGDTISIFISFGLIDPVEREPELLFNSEALLRMKKIERLKNDLGVNLEGVALALQLLERIEELELRIEHLQKRTD